MSSLEQSLDAIISKDRAAHRRAKQQRIRLTKKATPKRPAQAAVKKAPRGPAVAEQVIQTSTKVVVSGLPRDINPPAIKEFFNSQVGGVQTVHLAYNAQGKSTGNATVIFKTSKAARDSVAKYHNAPIDNGKSRLTLELVIDPSKKPLAARIIPNRPLKAKLVKKKLAKAPVKVGKNVRGDRRPQKKSLEQLDAEMADYFSKNE